MTSIQLHPAPAWSSVAREQVRAVGLRLRSAGIMLLALFALFAFAAIIISLDSLTLARGGQRSPDVTFVPQMTVLLTAFVILAPLMVWEGEDPTRRLYHRAMPVRQLTHVLAKVIGGWAWVVVATAVFLIGMAIVPLLMQRGGRTGDLYGPNFLWWYWLVPLTSVTIAYALTSAAGVGARQPFVWIFGPLIIYGGVIVLLLSAHIAMLTDIAHTMTTALTGTYGLRAAITGNIEDVEVAGRVVTALERWLGATAIWGAASAVLLYLVARRRMDTA